MVMYRIFFVLILSVAPYFANAQHTLGTTGTLNSPSARMQRDMTVTLGGNFLNKKSTPSFFGYDTYNYFLNATLLPFLEIAYTCTLLKATDSFVPEKKGRFVNQDRSLSARVRLFRERKFLPAIVLGGNDIFSSTTNDKLDISSNQYFSRIYLALSKCFTIGEEKIDLHAAAIYYRQQKGKGNNISAAVSYAPSIAKDLNLIAEYDSRFWNVGATYLLLNHLFLQVYLQEGKYVSGGVSYKIYLK